MGSGTPHRSAAAPRRHRGTTIGTLPAPPQRPDPRRSFLAGGNRYIDLRLRSDSDGAHRDFERDDRGHWLRPPLCHQRCLFRHCSQLRSSLPDRRLDRDESRYRREGRRDHMANDAPSDPRRHRDRRAQWPARHGPTRRITAVRRPPSAARSAYPSPPTLPWPVPNVSSWQGRSPRRVLIPICVPMCC